MNFKHFPRYPSSVIMMWRDPEKHIVFNIRFVQHQREENLLNQNNFINGWQLVKMKKSIPDMSLPWNL